MNLQRFDKFWIGFITGLIFPMFMFMLYWLFFHHQLNFPVRFVRYLMGGHLLSNVIKVCGLGNLILFYLALTNKMDRFTRGVILSLLFYVGLIAYVTYYLEPEIL